jgi:transcriptional regulator with XRE-family HTH domain
VRSGPAIEPGAVEPRALELSPSLRADLAQHNIGALYQALQLAGVSQRVIAAKTGQSQSEVSEILSGRRVQSIELLQRIVDGLGIARTVVGLAEPEQSTAPVTVTAIVIKPAPATAPPVPRVPTIIRQPAGAPATGAVDVSLWTGRDVWALRQSLRHTVKDFAGYLRVSAAVITKWEGGAIPNPFHQSLLDTALARLHDSMQARFARLASEDIGPAT